MTFAIIASFLFGIGCGFILASFLIKWHAVQTENDRRRLVELCEELNTELLKYKFKAIDQEFGT